MRVPNPRFGGRLRTICRRNTRDYLSFDNALQRQPQAFSPCYYTFPASNFVTPPIYGTSTLGIVTLPSAFW